MARRSAKKSIQWCLRIHEIDVVVVRCNLQASCAVVGKSDCERQLRLTSPVNGGRTGNTLGNTCIYLGIPYQLRTTIGASEWNSWYRLLGIHM